ncbi:hypothetical protein [Sphingomonas sp.]|jgi:hypothetical protein|uniref:hypothetical protein n=1 Tax=Sphingomonas sp. TaxID=28214 RepID=UPI002EDA49A1
MRRLSIIPLLIGLSACSSELDRANKELAFLEANDGTPRERCAAATKANDAATKAGDPDDYRYARITKQAECSTLDAFPAYADVPGGLPEASDEELEEFADQLAALNKMEGK